MFYEQLIDLIILFERERRINMGAIIMSILVSCIAIAGVIYFHFDDKKLQKKLSKN